ncbi:glycosyltransferase family 39 protein, partial [bacterium]|nr:glycosyltransferase family 39 protein [bacterium]
YKLILKTAGANNFASINYAALSFYLASTIFLFLIVRRLASKGIANITVILYPFIANLFIGRDAINPNAEIYMLSFALSALFFYLKFMDKKSYFMLIPGLLLGISTAFKQPCVFYFPVMVFMLFVMNKKQIKEIIYASIYLFSGIFAVWLIISFYFYSKNALWDFYFLVFGFNFLYCGDIAKYKIPFRLLQIYSGFFCSYPLIFPFYIFGLIRSYYLIIKKPADKKNRFLYSFLLLWHLSDLAGISQSGLFYYHYFIQLIPSMTAIMVIAFMQLINSYSLKKKIYFSAGFSIFMCVLVYQSLTERKIFQFYDPCSYIPPQKVYSQRKKIVKTYGKQALYYPYYRSIKRYWQILGYVKTIQRNITSDDPIFIWGNISEMYLLANRRPASRFIHVSFITGQFYGLKNLFYTKKKPLARYLNRIKKLLFDDFTKNPPKAILVSFHNQLEHTEFFWDYLKKNYDYKKTPYDLPLSLYIRKNE